MTEKNYGKPKLNEVPNSFRFENIMIFIIGYLIVI